MGIIRAASSLDKSKMIIQAWSEVYYSISDLKIGLKDTITELGLIILSNCLLRCQTELYINFEGSSFSSRARSFFGVSTSHINA